MKKLILTHIVILALFSSCRKTYECRCKEEFEGVQGYIEFSENIAMPKEKAKNVCFSNNREFENRKITCEFIK